MTGAQGNPMFQVNRYGKQPERAEDDGLEALSRGDLQKQAKEAGIKANQKSADIIEQLRAQRIEAAPAGDDVLFQAGRTPRKPLDRAAERQAIEEMKEGPGTYWQESSQMSLEDLRGAGRILGVTGNTKEKLAYRIREAYQHQSASLDAKRRISSASSKGATYCTR